GRPTVVGKKNVSRAKCFARERGAVGKRFELRPRDLRMRAAAEAAVAAGDDVFLADALGEALDPLRDNLGMLDDVGRMRDDAGDEDLSGWKFHVTPNRIFMLMP